MQLIRKLLASATAIGIAALAVPAAASAAPLSQQVAQSGACHVSLTGTVTQVISNTEFSMRVDNRRVGSIHVYDSSARVNTRGANLAVGTYVGAYGCFSTGMRSFNASEVTLAPSQAAYQQSLNSNGTAETIANQGTVGPCHVSLFGTVTQVWNNGVEFTLQTTGRIGNIHVYDKGARMNANGLNIQNGVYTGVYGCFIKSQGAFHANEVTLAQNASSYASLYHPAITVTGLVDEVGNGWIGVRTRYYGHVHVTTTQTNIRSGENVSIQGTYNAATRQINANSVAVI
ncbi:MAG TPA: hypothetical protein VFL13_07605 [Candidatus Baltobacteraceae bacterium]|nr:hypothetical protein [Candidatus Baltobacteraceae bacterium]